ncbi:hypothetical protein V1506DRAFT_533203, partial [Lipomyces tetrasporus]
MFVSSLQQSATGAGSFEVMKSPKHIRSFHGSSRLRTHLMTVGDRIMSFLGCLIHHYRPRLFLLADSLLGDALVLIFKALFRLPTYNLEKFGGLLFLSTYKFGKVWWPVMFLFSGVVVWYCN